MARFGDGLHSDLDPIVAAQQAIDSALLPLGGERPDLVCVFVSGATPDAVVAVGELVAQRSGARHVLGCSAGGVIGGEAAVEGSCAVSAWAAVLPGASFRSFHLETMRTPEGMAIVGFPEIDEEANLCLLLGDPYSFPGEGFLDGTNRAFPGLPVAGGMASARGGPGSTRLLLDGDAHDRGAVGVLLSGAVLTRTVVSQGCRPVGPPMVVTAAEGQLVLELAGVPALRRLDELLAALTPEDQALASRGLHLGVVIDEYLEHHERGDFLIRGVLGVDRERDGVVVGDVVEVGQTVRFQVRDAEAAEEDLRELLAGVREQPGGAWVEGALLFSCNGRGAAMFGDAAHDPRVLREAFATVPVAGFFAAGEFGPVGGRNHLHGFTASVVAFGPPPSDGGG